MNSFTSNFSNNNSQKKTIFQVTSNFVHDFVNKYYKASKNLTDCIDITILFNQLYYEHLAVYGHSNLSREEEFGVEAKSLVVNGIDYDNEYQCSIIIMLCFIFNNIDDNDKTITRYNIKFPVNSTEVNKLNKVRIQIIQKLVNKVKSGSGGISQNFYFLWYVSAYEILCNMMKEYELTSWGNSQQSFEVHIKGLVNGTTSEDNLHNSFLRCLIGMEENTHVNVLKSFMWFKNTCLPKSPHGLDRFIEIYSKKSLEYFKDKKEGELENFISMSYSEANKDEIDRLLQETRKEFEQAEKVKLLGPAPGLVFDLTQPPFTTYEKFYNHWTTSVENWVRTNRRSQPAPGSSASRPSSSYSNEGTGTREAGPSASRPNTRRSQPAPDPSASRSSSSYSNEGTGTREAGPNASRRNNTSSQNRSSNTGSQSRSQNRSSNTRSQNRSSNTGSQSRSQNNSSNRSRQAPPPTPPPTGEPVPPAGANAQNCRALQYEAKRCESKKDYLRRVMPQLHPDHNKGCKEFAQHHYNESSTKYDCGAENDYWAERKINDKKSYISWQKDQFEKDSRATAAAAAEERRQQQQGMGKSKKYNKSKKSNKSKKQRKTKKYNKSKKSKKPNKSKKVKKITKKPQRKSNRISKKRFNRKK